MTDFDEDSLADTLKASHQITSDSGPYRASYDRLHSGLDEIDELLEYERELNLEIARDSYLELSITGQITENPLYLYTPSQDEGLESLQEVENVRIDFGHSYDQIVPVEVVGHEYQSFDLSVPTFDSFRREAVRVLEDIQEEP